jgi:hypothetical protein
VVLLVVLLVAPPSFQRLHLPQAQEQPVLLLQGLLLLCRLHLLVRQQQPSQHH